MIDRPGIYRSMTSADYFADPCPEPSLTQSLAKLLIARSPLHAKCAHPRLRDPVVEDEVERYDKAKAIGSAAHLLMIGRGKDLEIADFDAWRSNDAKAVKDRAERSGKQPILRHHFAEAAKMVVAARTQLDAGGYDEAFAPDRGSGEVCVAWQEDGCWFRTLIDWLPHDLHTCWDIKTTEMSVAPHQIGRMMVEAGWDVQAAMHERGLLALYDHGVCAPDGGKLRPRFRFVAQEQEHPFAIVVVELPDEVMMIGRKKLDYAVGMWRECMRTGQWPAYSLALQTPAYPPWAEAQWLNREISEAAQQRRPERDARNLMAG